LADFLGSGGARDFPSHFHGPRSGPLEVRARIPPPPPPIPAAPRHSENAT